MSRRKMPAYRPQAERRHFVFVEACGCPFGLVEERKNCPDEDTAWDQMYIGRREERDARARGVHVVYVDHATYERELYPLMRPGYRCPHREAS